MKNPQASEASPGKAHVLVVDDHEMNRDMLSRRLRREGYRVTVAAGAREALDVMASQPVDLLLLDIMMPEISGLEVLEGLRRERSLADLPVLMVTARDGTEDVVRALELGANDYVTKPVDFPVLLARVRTHLGLRRLSQLKDEFLGIASHDLKNPLSHLLGTAVLIRSLVPPGTPMPEDIYELACGMEGSVRKMQGLIEDFLEFQASEDGSLKVRLASLDLKDLAREAGAGAAMAARQKGIALACDDGPDPAVVRGDAMRLAQVIQNLVDNALKFCRPGDRVQLRTSRSGPHVRLEVEDSGPGLTDEDLARVFTKFARLSNRPTAGESSTGLGLAIAKQFVEAQGGSIGVRNNPGGGATFWFELPAEVDRDLRAVAPEA